MSSLVYAVIPAPRDAISPRLEELRRVDGLDRTQLSAVPDERERVASATSGWAARLALRVGKGSSRR